MKLEVVVAPVSDVGRAKQFRGSLEFSDPDGNGWLFQEVRQRAPGR
jgi:hypothetical protein